MAPRRHSCDQHGHRANLGPQFDPKDLDYVEVNRGSYGAEFGDRTYGVFNVVPRTGFERNNRSRTRAYAGNSTRPTTRHQFRQPHRTLRLLRERQRKSQQSRPQTPVPQVVHDAENGDGGFGSLIYNADPSNQLRLMTSFRRDYFQIPYDPNPNDIENGSIAGNNYTPQYPSIGLRDGQTRSRYRRHVHLAAHFQFPSPDHGLAVLPLQQRRLRQQSQ